MTLEEFNNSDSKQDLLKSTCGSQNWVSQMINEAPFYSKEELLNKGEKNWSETNEPDWIEAFLHHPEIGNLESLREKYSIGKKLSNAEQSGINDAEESVLMELASQNKAYKERFGFIFIVFATGKTAKQMLDLLNERINNTKSQEMQIAMKEQWKITKLRLNNLITE